MMFADRQSVQLGASGIVFMFILLNSLLRLKSGTIPMTFILQLLLWCNKEIVAQVLVTTGSSASTSDISHCEATTADKLAGDESAIGCWSANPRMTALRGTGNASSATADATGDL